MGERTDRPQGYAATIAEGYRQIADLTRVEELARWTTPSLAAPFSPAPPAAAQPPPEPGPPAHVVVSHQSVVQSGRPVVEPEPRRLPRPGPARRRLSLEMQRRLVMVALLAGAVFVLRLWAEGSPDGWMDSYLNVANGVAQVSAMLGEYMFMAQVLLMARVPLLERALGTERLARMHSVLGFLVLWFITEHVVGVAVLNARHPEVGGRLLGAVSVFVGLWEVAAATAGTAVLYLIGYLSTRRMRAKISYESWRYLHLLVYLGLGLELVHQYTLGPHFLNSRFTSVVWTAMHAFVLATVVWFRVGRVFWLNLRHRLRVERVVDEGADVYSVYFMGRRLERLEGAAGQFMRFRFLNFHGWWQSHPFSLSAAPTGGYLRISVKELGDWTCLYGRHLRPGTRVFFSGPYGALTPARRKGPKVVLIAAGIGITPMRSLFAGLPSQPGDVTLIYRARREDELVFRAELDELARARGATVHYVLGPRESFPGDDPLGAKHLTALVPDIRKHDAYLCGPTGMVSAAIRGLRKAGVARSRIHSERLLF